MPSRVPIDVEAERDATPGTAVVTHLNNAGAALPSRATLDAQIVHLRLEASRGGYEAASLVAPRLDALRVDLAGLLGAAPDEVVVSGSDTQAWARAVWGFALGGGIGAGQRLLTDRLTYDSHYLALLQVAERSDASLEVLPSTSDGSLDLDALGSSLERGDVALCAATHVGTHRGLVNPVADIGVRCRAAGVPFFLDACQSVGQLPVDVESIGCDVLTTTGRKWLRGPRGTAVLYVRRPLAERMRPPGIGWSGAEWVDGSRYRLRPGADRFLEFEVPLAAHLGLGAAVAHARSIGTAAIAERVGGLAERLRTSLSGLGGPAGPGSRRAGPPAVTVHDGGARRCGIVTFTVEGVSPERVAAAAARADINVSVSEAAFARLDMAPPRPGAVVRASPHYYNTDDELTRLVEVVDGLARA